MPGYLRFALLSALAACSSAPHGTLQIVIPEGDTLSRTPATVLLRVDAVDSAGTPRTLASARLPTSSIDLGALDVSAVATLVVRGQDADGNPTVFGESLPVQLGALDGVTLPIFVQRTGQFASLPKPPTDARPAPTLGVFGGRYLFAGGGSDPSLAQTAQLYDFAGLEALSGPTPLPRVPRSVAFSKAVALLIDDQIATEFDLTGQLRTVDVQAPAGGIFADIAGGSTVFAGDGSQYVVGATRTTGSATATVLAIDPKGTPSWMFLTAPRLGAAAAWVDGRGLVVAGGSANAAGVEVVVVGSTTGSSLAYPPDASAGVGAARLDAQHVLLAGGLTPDGRSAGVRAVDVTCLAQCTPAPWAPLPVSLASTQAFASDSAHALVVGNEADGTTHVYRVSSTTAEPIDTRAVHTNARAVVSPIGSVVVVGGANEIESFVP